VTVIGFPVDQCDIQGPLAAIWLPNQESAISADGIGCVINGDGRNGVVVDCAACGGHSSDPLKMWWCNTNKTSQVQAPHRGSVLGCLTLNLRVR